MACTSVLLIVLIGWFTLENTWLDSYVRYTITQYPGLILIYLFDDKSAKLPIVKFSVLITCLVVIFAASGILSKQADQNRPDGPVPESVQILTWIILGVATVLFVTRLALVTYRYRTRPLFKITSDASIVAHQQTFSVKTNM